MKITENVHLIRQDFFVTPEVKRFINIYLITGENCYLIDSGVSGSEIIIEDYMQSIGRKLSEIKGVFLTHAHPDHIGEACEIKRRTGCQVYAPMAELEWIEDIDVQYRKRPIPNFYTLLSDSVKVDVPLQDGDIVTLENGLQIEAFSMPGHSHGSVSFLLNHKLVFTGDAIPVAHDLPIFTDYEQSLRSLDRILGFSDIQYFCPAWDEIYDKWKITDVITESRKMLYRLKDAVYYVENENPKYSDDEKIMRIFEQADILQYAGNPLVAKSIDACRNYLLKTGLLR